MDSSLTNFELTESALKNGSDSGSDKSDPTIDVWALGDNDSSNGNKSDEDFDNNLPETVTLLRHAETGAKVYLIGTAHFSRESQQDVEKVIQKVKPNIVVMELCPARTNILTLDEQTILDEAKNINFQKILSTIKTSGVFNGIMYLLLLDLSAHITKEIGMAPGGEFRVAYREAASMPDCAIHLGDRPIGITLKRALSRLTWCQTIKLVWHLINAKEPVSIEDIEKCKDRDMLEQLLAEFAGEYPAFREVFLDERDVFLTYSLQSAAAKKLPHFDSSQSTSKSKNEPIKVVGIVGIGHAPGIIKLWPHDQKSFIPDILIVPPPSRVSKFAKIGLKMSLYIGGGYLVYRYVPVPRILKDNIHFVVHNMLTSIKSTKMNFNFNKS